MYKISKLSNGIRVVTEYTDYVRSVSLGVWVGVGSAYEKHSNSGASHFIEHMMFKGTAKRSAKAIAEATDKIGAQLNAMTAKEYTCYYARALTENLDTIVDIVGDMLTASAFSEECIETERSVIAEEISMSEDTPEEYVHDCLSRIVWRDSALGFPIAGTSETIKKIDREALSRHFRTFYNSENIVISVVGSFDEAKLLDLLEKHFGGIAHGMRSNLLRPERPVRSFETVKKDIEQCHICLGLEGLAADSPLKYSLASVNALLGGNMSSRLFQSVREERGLAYSVYSYMNTYANCGSLVVYAGVSPENAMRATEVTNAEIKRLKREKFTEDELESVKNQLRASVLMGSESISARMSEYGRSLLLDGRIYETDEIINEINSVSRESCGAVIDDVLNSERLNVAMVGGFGADAERIAALPDF